MKRTDRRLLYFLAGLMTSVWILALAGMLAHIRTHWPRETVTVGDTAGDDACWHRSTGSRTWDLRVRADRPPIHATEIRSPDGTVGLALCGLRPGDPFYRAGLRSGDVLRGVDAVRPTSPPDALEACGRIVSGEARMVTYERGGAMHRTGVRTGHAGR